MNEWVEKISPDIHDFLKDQGKIITGQIKDLLEKQGFGKKKDDNSTKADAILSSYASNSWATDLDSLLKQLTVEIYVDGMKDAQTTLTGSFVSDPIYHEYANAYAEERSAELVTKLDDSTKNMLRSDLVSMMEEGLTPAEIAANLEENYAFSEYRSMMIARTETGFTWNRSTVKMYSESGVKMVYVHDGDYDEDCRAANGQVWSADYASINALGHPNCVRSFSPCLEPDVQPDEY